MAIDREKILQSAQKLVDKKRYDKAIAEYRKLIADDPGDVRTLLKIGDLHLKLEQYEPAISTYEQVGEYYYREGFSVKAIAVYKQIRGIIRRHAVHLEGRYGHIVPRLAEIYTQLGLTSDALAAYDEVATRLRQEGRERDALDIFKKVVELDPQNPIAHLRVADSRARLGDMDKAVERFGEAARIMVNLGRRDDALKVLERLLEYRSDPAYARMAAEIYLERDAANDGMAALTKLQVAFKANPKDLDTLAMLARAFDAIEQPKKAVEVMKESARIAKEGGHIGAFNSILDTLVARAPEDTLVVRLNQQRRAASQPDADVSVEVINDAELESIEEVFELEQAEMAHGELVQRDLAHGEMGFDTMLEGPGADETSGVRRLIGEAERQRSVGQLGHAIQLLRDGLRNMGGSHALRHKLSDLLLEAGDTTGCITEKLILAQELANEGNVEHALGIIDEVLLLSPGQPDAAQMRANLGYPLSHLPGHDQAFDDLQLNQPLMSYDVESGGVEEALHRSRHHSAPVMPAMALDDPFASSSEQPPPHLQSHGQAHAYQQQYAHHPAQQAHQAHQYQQPYTGPTYQPATYAAPQSPVAYAPPMAERRVVPPPVYAPPSLDENALDAAESLAEQGRFDEARALLHGQLQMLPNHPLVLERLADIDALSAQVHSSRRPDAPVQHADTGRSFPAMPSGPASEPLPLSQAEYEYAAAGAAYEPYREAPSSDVHGAQAVHHTSYAGPQLDLDQMRAGVRNQVAESDAATHYDLGVAYLEMGLHSDAISELTLAARDPSRECVCLSMIASIQLQLGDYDAALEVLHRALNTQYKTRDQELALAYEIASTYEVQMMPEQALHYFEWLGSVEPNYVDAGGRGSALERTHRLRSESGAQPRPRAPSASGAPDTADMAAAFDDLFEEGQ